MFKCAFHIRLERENIREHALQACLETIDLWDPSTVFPLTSVFGDEHLLPGQEPVDSRPVYWKTVRTNFRKDLANILTES
jgi:hypothetical protein